MKCKFCETDATTKGMCGIHYGRWYRTGNPEKSQQGKRQVKPIQERMVEHRVIQDNNCWHWTAGINQYGYGKVKYDNRTRGAHIVAWYLATGRWPEEELDHLCHTLDTDCIGGVACMHRRCINPEHLEEVSKVENTRRRDIRRNPNAVV